MATLVVLVSLLIMGSFISAAFLRFFQQKVFQGVVYLIIGIITIILFYFGLNLGWTPLPQP
jgi:hypothetical protein